MINNILISINNYNYINLKLNQSQIKVKSEQNKSPFEKIKQKKVKDQTLIAFNKASSVGLIKKEKENHYSKIPR
ncbi:MAG: hypothetical protein AABX04_01280 [Nanoarchaeota archaeon]